MFIYDWVSNNIDSLFDSTYECSVNREAGKRETEPRQIWKNHENLEKMENIEAQ
jgi:hypothetical protein